MVLVDGVIVHSGVSARLVPVSWAQVGEVMAVRKMSEGKWRRSLPEEDRASFIVTENVYVVILLTTSLPLPVNDPVNVVAIAVSA